MKTIILLASAFTLALFKPFDGKAGLWERTVTIDGRISEDALAKMPPTERAQVEATMKDRLRVPMTTKVCLTRESMGKPFSIPGRNCTLKLVSSSASRLEVNVDCASGPIKTRGDVVGERVDSEHVKGTMTMETISADPRAGDGRTEYIKMTTSDTWLSADCGQVKPTGVK